jgi:hypothetical protein
MIRPDDVPAAFVADGTCRNIYVLNATPSDWLALLHLARDRRTLRSRFTVGDNSATIPNELPHNLWATAGHTGNQCAHLTIDLGRVTLHCDFLSADVIELDLHPRDFHQDAFAEVVEFMESLGRRTGRDVLLTPEINPDAPIFLYEAATDRMILPHQRREHGPR